MLSESRLAAGCPGWLRNRDACWVKPVMTPKVRHLAFGSGLLRHAEEWTHADQVGVCQSCLSAHLCPVAYCRIVQPPLVPVDTWPREDRHSLQPRGQLPGPKTQSR